MALLGSGAGGVGDIAAHAERALAGTGQHHDAHGLVVGSSLQRLTQFEDRLGAKRIEALRTVDRNRRPAIAGLVEDVLVCHAIDSHVVHVQGVKRTRDGPFGAGDRFTPMGRCLTERYGDLWPAPHPCRCHGGLIAMPPSSHPSQDGVS